VWSGPKSRGKLLYEWTRKWGQAVGVDNKVEAICRCGVDRKVGASCCMTFYMSGPESGQAVGVDQKVEAICRCGMDRKVGASCCMSGPKSGDKL
jgi:CDGSH-type Zn-finger protein